MESGETIFYPRTINTLSKESLWIGLDADFGDLVKSNSVSSLRPKTRHFAEESLGIDTFGNYLMNDTIIVKNHKKIQHLLKQKYNK